MTRRRWIADEVDLSRNRAALTAQNAAHLARVLRARVGQEFDLVLPGDSTIVRAGRVTAVSDHRVEFELGEQVAAPKQRQVTLYLAVFKFDRMEWAIEKCTELGVTRIQPLIARRTDSHLAAAATKRLERWRRIVRQAAEQSRRSVPPEIVAPIKLSEALDFPAALHIVLAESEEQTLLRDVVKSGATRLETLPKKDLKENDLKDKDKNEDHGVVLAVGPEGGWIDEELQSFRQAGWISVSMGNTILRAETAAIAATAIVASELNSF